jgi:hypothetical protein
MRMRRIMLLYVASQKRHNFRKKLLNMKCVLIFSSAFVWNISHFMKNWARCYNKRTLVLMWNVRYSYQSLMKPAFSRQIFEKSSNVKFHENPSSGSRENSWKSVQWIREISWKSVQWEPRNFMKICPLGAELTDRYDEANFEILVTHLTVKCFRC